MPSCGGAPHRTIPYDCDTSALGRLIAAQRSAGDALGDCVFSSIQPAEPEKTNPLYVAGNGDLYVVTRPSSSNFGVFISFARRNGMGWERVANR